MSVKEYQLYSVIPTLLFLFHGYFWPGLFPQDKAYKLHTQASEKGLVCIVVPIAVLVLEALKDVKTHLTSEASKLTD